MRTRPCPACNGKVSFMAESCPHCGHPLEAKQDTYRYDYNPDKRWNKWQIGGIASLVFLCFWHVICAQVLQDRLNESEIFEEVQINFFTNTIYAEVDESEGMLNLMSDEYESIINVSPRSNLDIYAMFIPYKIVFLNDK